MESNVENVYGEASKMAERIIDCEMAILDIKEYIMGMADGAISRSVPAMNQTQALSELNMLKQQVSDLHQHYARQSKVVNSDLSETDQYHKDTMLVGGMTNFDSKTDAEN